MTVSYKDARVEARTIAPWLIPVISTTSADGTADYLIDTLLLSDVNNSRFNGKDYNTKWVFLPAASTASDREKQIGGNSGTGLDTTNARVYPVSAYSGTTPVASGAQYEIHSLRPKDTFDLLVVTMRQFKQPTFGPLTAGNDEDMEATGVTSYSTTSGNALTKVTAAGNVASGKQSLFLDADGVNQYAEGATYNVDPNTGYFAATTVRVDVGGPAIFKVWDKTNDAEIESGSEISHSLESFMTMWRNFTTPATCEQVALRVYGTGSSDDIYIDHFHAPHKGNDGFLYAPSWMDRDVDFRKLMVARYSQSVTGNKGSVYDFRSQHFYDDFLKRRHYDLRIDHFHANPNRIEFMPGVSLPNAELWVEALRSANDITAFAFTAAGETSPTTNLPKRLIVLDWVVRCCDLALSIDPTNPEALATLGTYTKTNKLGDRSPKGEYADLLSDYARDLETPTQAPHLGYRNMALV